MTLKEALAKGIDVLKTAGIETPAVDAGVLLCSAAGCDRTFLYAHGEDELDVESRERYMSYLGLRCKGTPVQYITGRCGFMSLDFLVGPGVLVPRPETEILVEAAAEVLSSVSRPTTVLDIGTGSGCIAVSIAHMVKNCRVTAVDVSGEALAIARRNAAENGVLERLEFISSDLFESLGGCRFDAIVSNPPYIRSGDIQGLQREVRDFEPHTALDGGPDGLAFYRRIIEKAPEYLNENGRLLLEVGFGQACEVAKLLENRYDGIEIRKDLAGIDRVVKGKLKLM